MSIGNFAFKNCTSLENVIIPSVETIEYGAFENCSNLSVELELHKIVSIGNYAFMNSGVESVTMHILQSLKDQVFMNCKNLKKVILPEVVSLGNRCFQSCTKLEYVLIGSSITTIEWSAFEGDVDLKCVVVLAETPPTLGDNVFRSAPDSTIYVPDPDGTGAIVQAYKTATNWSTYASRIFPISQLATDNPELYAEVEEYL